MWNIFSNSLWNCSRSKRCYLSWQSFNVAWDAFVFAMLKKRGHMHIRPPPDVVGSEMCLQNILDAFTPVLKSRPLVIISLKANVNIRSESGLQCTNCIYQFVTCAIESIHHTVQYSFSGALKYFVLSRVLIEDVVKNKLQVLVGPLIDVSVS